MEVGIYFWTTLFAGLIIYWALPRWRDWLLILLSAAYLIRLNPWSLVLLLGWFLLFFLLAPKTQGRSKAARRILAALVLSVLGYLVFVKVVPSILVFAAAQFGVRFVTLKYALPLGISYFTFKLIHYAIEVSRDRIESHPPRLFLLYLLLFTIFPAGPIQRFDHFVANRQHEWDGQLLAVGLTRVIHGLIKKFLIAETVIFPLISGAGISTRAVLLELETVPFILVWIHAALWYLYFYMDFSAYSDIAIGSSRLFGFKIQENFNHPLLATHIGDFWQRWHMSLAQWCRAYVYMPLIGLTRLPYLAVYVTMIVIALWHAVSPHWLVWGLYHATGLVIFQTWLRLKRYWRVAAAQNVLLRTLARGMTFAFIASSYSFLASQSYGLYQGLRLYAKLFNIYLPP